MPSHFCGAGHSPYSGSAREYMATDRASWHDRPIIGPISYFIGTTAVSIPSYAFGYLLTNSARWGICTTLAMALLCVLYLRECHKSQRRKRYEGKRRTQRQ